MSGNDPALRPAGPRRAPRWSRVGTVMFGIDAPPASMAGLPASSAMVWVGPPSLFRARQVGGFLTPTWMPLRAVGVRPPEPPVPNRSYSLTEARLPLASLGRFTPAVFLATMVLYRAVEPDDGVEAAGRCRRPRPSCRRWWR